MRHPIHSKLLLNSKVAIIFGVMLFIVGCGLVDIPLIAAAVLLVGFGVQVVCEYV